VNSGKSLFKLFISQFFGRVDFGFVPGPPAGEAIAVNLMVTSWKSTDNNFSFVIYSAYLSNCQKHSYDPMQLIWLLFYGDIL